MIKPMMAHAAKDEVGILSDPCFAAERKYDGHRAILEWTPDAVTLTSRLGKDKTDAAPFLQELKWSETFRKYAATWIFDGELVVPGGSSSDVVDLANRDRLIYVVFDVVQASEITDVHLKPFAVRRRILENLVPKLGIPRFQVSEISTDGKALFQKVKEEGGEGVMMKDWTAAYQFGKRSWAWQKVKIWDTWDVVVTGCDAEPTKWTVRPGHVGTDGVLYPDGKPSSTSQAGYVGLTYGWYVDGKLKTVGKLGYTGLPKDLEPLVGTVAEVKAWGLYPSGALRHPGVVRFRDDKLPEECVLSDEMVTLK